MLTIFSCICFFSAFIVSLIVFPSLRKAITKVLEKLEHLARRHWSIILLFCIIALSIILNKFTIQLFSFLSYFSLIILVICIILGAIWRKAFKYAWKIGGIAIILMFITVLLGKLPW